MSCQSETMGNLAYNILNYLNLDIFKVSMKARKFRGILRFRDISRISIFRLFSNSCDAGIVLKDGKEAGVGISLRSGGTPPQ